MQIYAINIKQLNNCNFDYKKYEKLISEHTIHKAKKFKYFNDTVRTVIGELLINHLYSKYHNVNSLPIPIFRDKYGKPCSKIENFNFNISHSGEWVVCIIDKKRVGIDIELIKEDIDYNSLISLFHPFEIKQMEKQTNPKDYFYDLWTVKESILKNIGAGLSLPLTCFYVHFLQNEIKLHFEENFPKTPNMYIKRFNIDSNYKISVCTLENKFPANITHFDVFELLSQLDLYID